MLISHFATRMLSVGLIVLGTGVVSGQDYPNKPIRLITGAGAGSGAGVLARIVAGEISGPLGQPAIVDSRSAMVSIEAVSKAPPDGYNLLFLSQVVWILPLLQNVSYDPMKDFSPITLAAKSPLLLIVHPSLPVKSVKELIALAKAKPGELNATTGNTGGSGHLALELFKSLARVNILRIPYASGSQESTDLLSGRMQMTLSPGVELLQYVKAGRLRALAVTTAQPSALFPQLPTLAASGVPGYEWIGTTVVLAPGNTPTAIINRLNVEIARVLNRKDVKEKTFDLGLEVVGSSPEELRTRMTSEIATISKLIKDAGIKVDK